MNQRNIFSKGVVLVSAVLLVFVLASCGGKTETAEDGVSILTAEDERDERGWQGRITIAVEGNEIRAVDYDEYDADGNRKSLDSGYADRWSEQYPGMGPAMAIKQLEAQLVDGGSVDAVDGVSGATGTTSRFQAIAESALAGR